MLSYLSYSIFATLVDPVWISSFMNWRKSLYFLSKEKLSKVLASLNSQSSLLISTQRRRSSSEKYNCQIRDQHTHMPSGIRPKRADKRQQISLQHSRNISPNALYSYCHLPVFDFTSAWLRHRQARRPEASSPFHYFHKEYSFNTKFIIRIAMSFLPNLNKRLYLCFPQRPRKHPSWPIYPSLTKIDRAIM